MLTSPLQTLRTAPWNLLCYLCMADKTLACRHVSSMNTAQVTLPRLTRQEHKPSGPDTVTSWPLLWFTRPISPHRGSSSENKIQSQSCE